jgi:hypothetical protein
MKTKLYYIFCLFLVVLVISCSREQDDLFSEGSSQRADKAMAEYLNILTSAENGWLLDYYPSPTFEYGGYNILLKFNTNGEVDINGEFTANSDTLITSLYSIKQDAGITLSFSTYNMMFHIFSDPSDPFGIGGKGDGMLGDYDFLILNASAEKVLLKGKKTGNIMSMRPMAKNDSWSDYITKMQDASKAMLPISRLVLTINKEYRVDVGIRNLIIYIPDEDGNVRTETLPFIGRQTGYELYEPYELDGVTISSFTFEPATMSFYVEGKPEYKMVKYIPPINEFLISSEMYISYDNLPASAQEFWKIGKDNLLKAENEELAYAYVGMHSSSENFAFVFKSGKYTGAIYLDYELIGEDKIKMKCSGGGDNNGIYYLSNTNAFIYFIYPFVGVDGKVIGVEGRTFTITADDKENPTYLVLKDDADPTNVIKLVANRVAPF